MKCVTESMVFVRSYAASNKSVTHLEWVRQKYKEYRVKMIKNDLTPATYFTWLQCQV